LRFNILKKYLFNKNKQKMQFLFVTHSPFLSAAISIFFSPFIMLLPTVIPTDAHSPLIEEISAYNPKTKIKRAESVYSNKEIARLKLTTKLLCSECFN